VLRSSWACLAHCIHALIYYACLRKVNHGDDNDWLFGAIIRLLETEHLNEFFLFAQHASLRSRPPRTLCAERFRAETQHLNYTNLILYNKRNKRMNSILDIKIFLRFGQGSHKCFFCRLETFVDFKYIVQVLIQLLCLLIYCSIVACVPVVLLDCLFTACAALWRNKECYVIQLHFEKQHTSNPGLSLSARSRRCVWS